MKLTIDTDRKVIEIDQTIKIKDLLKGLKELLGNEWEKYSIEQRIHYYPYYPSYPYITTTGDWPFYFDYNTIGQESRSINFIARGSDLAGIIQTDHPNEN